MKLEFWDRAREPTVVDADEAALDEAIDSVDWSTEKLASVSLRRDRDNWADCTGSFVVGMALMLEEDGVQHVANEAAGSLEEVREFLNAYLRDDMQRVFEILYGRTLPPEELAAVRQAARGETSGYRLGCVLIALGILVAVVLGWLF